MLDVLRKLTQEVNSAENLHDALDIIVNGVKKVMQTDVCSVYLTDFDSEERVLMASNGLHPDSVGHVRLPFGQGLVNFVAERAEPFTLEDAASHDRYVFLPETAEEHFHGFLGVPIIHHRKIMGVLIVQTRQTRSFDEDEITLLVTIAAQLAGAIAHADASGDIEQLQKNPKGGNRPFKGVPGAPGVAMGKAMVIYPPADLASVPHRTTKNIEEEVQVFVTALSKTRDDIVELRKRVEHLPSENAALFDAYIMMLQSHSFVDNTLDEIKKGLWASTALKHTVQTQAQIFEEMEDPYLRERAQDIKDIGRRILVHIQSNNKGKRREYADNTVIVGEEISVSDLIEIPPEKLAGIISTMGSGSSHVAILARALAKPAIMGVAELPVSRTEGQTIIVDGYQGSIYVSPDATVIREYKRLIREEAEIYRGLENLKNEVAQTPDGVRIPLLVNSGLLSDVSNTVESGAEGIGLYRTEFPFMIRDRFPGEEEQTQIYQTVLKSLKPKPVTLRTLDIGGDKNLSYFPIKEDNPFLGWRGIRISLDHPDIFMTQLRAMLRANAEQGNLKILLPMISSVSEVDESLALLRRAYEELQEDGFENIKLPELGAMIEVPSAVYQATPIARRVDFLSIGTNDLVQYLLAVDRNNANVAELYDFLHPAIIHAVHHVVRSGESQGVPVSVCGEMAGDPAAAILLLGMGIDNLSINLVGLPRIKWVIRSFDSTHARQLLDRALSMDNASQIRNMLHEELEAAGLGSLLRAGK